MKKTVLFILIISNLCKYVFSYITGAEFLAVLVNQKDDDDKEIVKVDSYTCYATIISEEYALSSISCIKTIKAMESDKRYLCTYSSVKFHTIESMKEDPSQKEEEQDGLGLIHVSKRFNLDASAAKRLSWSILKNYEKKLLAMTTRSVNRCLVVYPLEDPKMPKKGVIVKNTQQSALFHYGVIRTANWSSELVCGFTPADCEYYRKTHFSNYSVCLFHARSCYYGIGTPLLCNSQLFGIATKYFCHNTKDYPILFAKVTSLNNFDIDLNILKPSYSRCNSFLISSYGILISFNHVLLIFLLQF